MDSRKPLLVVIVGPTASGKSELAVRLARKFNGEIISADSRQIYRGLDIGTGKVAGKWIRQNVASTRRPLRSCNIFIYRGIPHYCIDFVPPQKTFTAAEYKKCAQSAIYDIASRKKLPILVGGTGFWIDTVAYDINLPAAPPNWALRRKLGQKSPAELLAMLRRLDPDRARTIEPQNPRRLIRAIEVAKTIGQTPKVKRRKPYRALWIGFRPSETVLGRRIKLRARAMIRRGLVAETKKLIQKGVSKKRIWEFGFEYQTGLDMIEKRITPDELRRRLAAETLNYAGRQMRWFKRNPAVRWLKKPAAAYRLVDSFIA